MEVITTTMNGEIILSVKCTCKAVTGKCKPIVGLIFKLQKTSKDELAELNCTDLPQKWGKLFVAASKLSHNAISIKQFCHVQNHQFLLFIKIHCQMIYLKR